jgi:hypothetical protein
MKQYKTINQYGIILYKGDSLKEAQNVAADATLNGDVIYILPHVDNKLHDPLNLQWTYPVNQLGNL